MTDFHHTRRLIAGWPADWAEPVFGAFPVCVSCRAAHESLVTRRIDNPQAWSLVDAAEDLSVEFPDTWGPAHRVQIQSGRCETCRDHRVPRTMGDL